MVNEVRLAGRVTRGPEERVLPSGDKVVTFRVSVPRDQAASRPGADWVDCSVWRGALRRSVGRWSVDDEVEVAGAFRRRVFRASRGVVPVLEVEVSEARRLRGAGRA